MISNVYKLTPMQLGMLFHSLLDKESNAYFEQVLFSLKGEIDGQLLEKSFNTIIQRYDILRTIFHIEDKDQPLQIVLKQRKSKVHFKNIEHLSEEEQEQYLQDFMVKDKKKGFDLTLDILTRLSLLKTGKFSYKLIWSFHHILMDGWCLGIIYKDLSRIYYSLKKGEPFKLEPVTPYVNYIKWLETQDKEQGLKYWREYLQGVEEQVGMEQLGQKKSRQQDKYEVATYAFRLDEEKTTCINKIAVKNNTTVNTVFQTFWGILLQRYNNTNDVIYGAVVSGRPPEVEGIETMVGLFINTVPVRLISQGEKNFSQLLRDLQEKNAISKSYDYLPLAEIQTQSSLKNKLIDHIMAFENYPIKEQVKNNQSIDTEKESKLKVENVTAYEQTNYHFNIIVSPGKRLFFSFNFNSLVFDMAFIKRTARHFTNIVNQVAENPNIFVRDIEIATPEEKHQLLFEFNDTHREYPQDKTIHELFAAQVEQTPDNTALVGGNPKSQIPNPKHRAPFGQINAFGQMHLSYRELNEKSHQLAYVLKEKGIKPDIIVGIMLERSIEIIIGIFGILKAGGAYLPIDANYPEERIDFMLKDSGVEILLKDNDFTPEAFINSPKGASSFGIWNLEFGISPRQGGQLAYVLYTSGSTGKPKGVMVNHHSVLRLVKNTNFIAFDPRHRLLQTGALDFDASTFEIWGPLLNGALLCLASRDHLLNPDRLKTLIREKNITIMWMTAPLFNRMLQADIEIFRGLECLLVGGDVLSPPHIRQIKEKYPQLNVINGYGPTENTTFSTTHPVQLPITGTIPIGKPIANSTAYILDKYDHLVPVGVPGELVVGGDGAARGYLNKPELTAERFFSFFNRSYKSYRTYISRKIYKTGDLARWLPDGAIEFLGRQDFQVKIRGFRIEPGEIENRLLNHPQIREAVVIARQQEGKETDEKYICAYIVPDRDQKPKPSDLCHYLAGQLPDYMVPTHFVLLEKIPLTSSGKVQRNALPEPGFFVRKNYVPPGSTIEKKLAAIWSEVLHWQGAIGIDDNFFELGGHSLTVTIMASKICKKFDVKMTLTEVFSTPTIRGLVEHIKKKIGERYVSIEPAEEKEFYALSSAQKRLYILQQMESAHVGYNMPQIIPLEENIDIKRLELAFKELITRHESLRTSFHMMKNEPVQKIHKDVEFEIEYYENYKLQITNKAEPHRQLLNADGVIPRDETKDHHSSFIIHHSFIRPFDLAQAPLLRVMIIESQSPGVKLFIDMHHIITDGTSQNILKHELLSLYTGEKLTAPRLQYKDYAQWQNNHYYQASITAQQDYWSKIFPDELPVLNLPIDFPRSLTKSFEGSTIAFILTTAQTKQVKELSKQANITLFMLVMAVFNVLLSKLSNQEDIIIGIPVMGRRHADLERIIGMFVNTLALRNYPIGNKPFKEFLQEVKESTLTAFENQDYQFDELVKQLPLQRDTDRNPLFDVMFNFLNQQDYTNYTLEMDKRRLHQHRKGVSKFDLTLTAVDLGENLLCSFEYSTKLFESRTIDRIVEYFKKVFDLLLKDPGQKLSEIGIITRLEKKRILYDFNDTQYPYPGNKSLHQLFAEQVERIPDHIAVIGSSGIKYRTYMTYISYRELNDKSDQLAHLLIEKGVRPDTLVAIVLERSIEMIIGILGILKAGGAYLPIDPNYPEERIQYILKDSGAGILLKDNDFTPGAFNNGPKGSSIPPSTLLPFYPSNPSNLAYIIYTSGSTGKPKGVLVEQSSVVNLLSALSQKYPLSPGDTYLLKTSYTFDVSVTELFAWFWGGGQVTILEKGAEKEPQKILDTIERARITHINFVPSMFAVFLEILKTQSIRKLSHLKYMFLAGEALLPGLVKKFIQLNPGVVLENLYGPTETTIYASQYSLSEWNGSSGIPIGKPLANLKLYILDRYDHLQPLGVVGELCISGIGLARGYLNRPELTAGKFCLRRPGALFIKTAPGPRKNFLLEESDKSPMQSCNHAAMQLSPHHPPQYHITPVPHHPIYRTGDLARWLPDGAIEFLGRRDFQVKVRGFRIEPGEIENRLLNHPQVREAVVIARQQEGKETDEKYICAYIVPDRDQKPKPSDLRHYLAGQLPDYMVPAHFVLLEKIPLTSSGKVQRNALPEPGFFARKNYVPPGSNIEKKLAAIWSEVLHWQGAIGIDDNFFELGGHSLTVTVMASKICKKFDIKITLTEVFNTPTIRGLVEHIKKKTGERYASIEPAEEKEFYALSSAQKRLYILQQMESAHVGYNMPQIIPLAENIDIKRLGLAFKELIARHESLRTSFHMKENEPVQKIHKDVEFEIEYYENYKLQITNKAEPHRQVLNADGVIPRDETKAHHSSFIIHHSFIRPFDLSQAPLLRVGLIEYPHTPAALRGHPSQEGKRQQYILMIDMHHIITDGVSQNILKHELLSIYAGEKLIALRLQYKDYAQWQNNRDYQVAIAAQQDYWSKIFPDELPVLNLPTDFSRSLTKSFEGSTTAFILTTAQTKRLKDLSKKANITLFMLVMAVFNVLLSKLSNQEDIIIGIPIMGRRHADLERVIGMFVNTLALRNYPAGNKTFEDFLQEIKESALGAFENQDYQFDELVKQFPLQRSTDRNPIFDVMFNFLNQRDYTDYTMEMDKQRLHHHQKGVSKFDLTLTAVDLGEKLLCSLEYSTKLFESRTIDRIIEYFRKIFDLVFENPGQKLAEIEIITSLEKHRILNEFNNTGSDYPWDKTISECFEQQVARMPNHIVVIGIGHRDRVHNSLFNRKGMDGVGTDPCVRFFIPQQQITYLELNQRANQLAHLLQVKGAKPDTIVGIMMERFIEIVTGILGILKAGGAYLPIDPDYPEERIDFMLKDSGAEILLKDNDFTPEGHPSTLPPFYPSQSSNLAYVIYTSGTAGKPKGVLIQHHNVVRLMVNDKFPFDFNENDTWTLFHSTCFDFSVWEMYGALFYGGKLVIVPKIVTRDTERFLQLLKEKQVTVLNQTPSAFYHLAQLELNNPGKELSIRYIIFGGEALAPTRLKEWKQKYPGTKLINMYGITETTVHVTFKELTRREIETNTSNIGKPIPTLSVYLTDKYLKPVPVGVAGEIVVVGAGVGRGYLNRPEFTSGRFCFYPLSLRALKVPDQKNHRSYRSHMSYILYKSGDLARWLPNGEMEYLGRIDQQVKIRGFRVEPGEIENRLLNHPQIREAVVIDRQQQGKATNEKYLCAYIVPGRNQKPKPSDLRHYLAAQLPDYMVPAHFILLDRIPLTSNGKVQRNALPEPEFTADEGYAAPTNPVELQLTEIWSETLGVRGSIGIDDNFFELGGHSLKATVLAAKIHQTFHVKIPLKDIFSSPTIKELAAYIPRANKNRYREIEKLKESDFYEPSYHQKRLWVLHQLSPESPAFHMPGKLVLNHEVDEQTIQKTLYEIVQRHESFRTGFKLLNDQPMQFILKENEPPLQMIDISTRKQEEKQQERDRIYTEIALKPFQLDQPPLFRSVLVKSGPRHYEFMFNVHHIISDGWSMEILTRDFYEIYEAYQKGKEVKLLPPGIQYKDFAAMHNQQLKDPVLKKEAQEFWKEKFQGAIPALKFHGSLNKNINDQKGAGYQWFIDAQLKNKLQKTARENNTSLFMVMFSVYILFLSRFTGEQDIACSFIGAGREHAALHNIIGFFVNSVIFRTRVDERESFEAFLQRVNKDILEIFAYQSYPLELVFEELQVRYPDIPVSFNMVNIRDAAVGREHRSNQPGHVEKSQDVKFDLEPYIREYKNGIHIYWAYRKSLFTPKIIEYMASEYSKLLDYFPSHLNSNYKTYRDRGIKPTFKKRG